MNVMRKPGAWLLAGALALSGASACAERVTGSFERTLTLDGAIELSVATGSGSIRITDGRAGQARIVGRIAADTSWGFFGHSDEAREAVRRIEAEPPVDLEGGVLRVGDLDGAAYRHVSISYEIQVPADTRVRSRSGSGSQSVSGLQGAIEASAGSGQLSFADIGGAVEASAGSGSIHADRIAGGFDARTGSGSIRLVQSAPGDVSISTGSGSSRVSGVDGALRMRSGSGSITVEGSQSGPWRLEAGSGSIRVRLPDDAAFDLDAEAHSGGVYTEHPVAVQGTIARGRLTGQVRGGGPLLQVRTGSGAIRIE